MITIRIDWEHETFEAGLQTWRTEFRGFLVEIRKEPGVDHQVVSAISAGEDPLQRTAFPNEQIAMTESLKWINGYWDLLEDGPVTYQAMDVAPHLSQQPEEISSEDDAEGCA